MSPSPHPGRQGFPVATGRWPVLGHYPAINRDPWRFFQAGAEAHGNLFWVDPGFSSWTLVAHGEAAFRDLIMTTDHRRAQRSLARKHAHLLGRRVISALDGQEHRRVRRPLLGGLSRLAELAPMVHAHAARGVDQMLTRGGGRLSEVTRVYTMSVALGLLGIDSGHAAEWQRVYQRFTLGFFPLSSERIGTPRWFAQRAKRWIDAQLEVRIAQARSRPGATDLLSRLVQEQQDAEQGLTDEELLDNLRHLLAAGVHTSAQAITWMLAYLATDRRLWDEVAAEVDGMDALPRTAATLAELPLLAGLLREAMRMRPIMIGLTRRAGEGLHVAGRPIVPGTTLLVPLPSLLTDPSRYRDPMRFDPRRWADLGRPRDPVDSAGFGGGAHFCAGHQLTWLEASTFVAALVRAATRSRRRLQMDRLPGTRVLGPAIEAIPSQTEAHLVRAS
ncbi:MAG: cytochrome P450 [Deltaproteobacteria bacterium]|nr:cytochrome P450 [Deltaproteobacteria bacterium]